MKRTQFLKSLFVGAIALTAIPITKAISPEKEKFSFDEIFHRPWNNQSLVYLKSDSEIYKTIRKSVENRVVEKERFRHYLGVYDILIPVKQEYTIADFDHVIMAIQSGYKRHNFYSEHIHGTFLYFFHGMEMPDRMHLELFLADGWAE